MEYVLPLLLVLLGVVNGNLVRVALQTGKIQSRLMNLTREASAFGFWSAVIFQVLVSVVCFAVAAVSLSTLLQQ